VRDAADVLARLKGEDPLSRETRGFELEVYLKTSRIEEAAALADQLCRLFPDSGRILFLAGKAAYRKKNYDEAEARFRESYRIYQQWLGKTLTQAGKFEEAEPLLAAAAERTDLALLDLVWLHERRNDLEAALAACDAFLKKQPNHAFASQQRLRLKAKILEPEALIEEMDSLEQLGEKVPSELFPEFVQGLFETGQSPRARAEILSRLEEMDSRLAVRVAWICYRAQAYDLACTLFLIHLEPNVSNFKYLNALEAAAARCQRIPQLLEAYQPLMPNAPHLFGRFRSLQRRKPTG
jgi:tetratricopeptide (TPR) repeat protein